MFCLLNIGRLGIPTTAVDALQTVFDSFKAAYLKVAEDGNYGSGDIAVKSAERGAVITALKEFVGSYVRPNKNWTYADLINAGFPQPGASSGGKIETSPVISLTGKIGGFIKAHGQARSGDGHGLPPFANILEFAWAYKNTDGAFPAADEIPISNSVLSFGANAAVNRPAAEKGREMGVYGRYLNHESVGPWSDPVSIMIT